MHTLLTPASLRSYQSKFNLCARCLADAQFLANKANLPAHPDPDFFDYNNGLVMQLNNAFVDGCYEPGNFGPLDNSPETLAHYLCVTREITERFGGPIAVSLSSFPFSPMGLNLPKAEKWLTGTHR